MISINFFDLSDRIPEQDRRADPVADCISDRRISFYINQLGLPIKRFSAHDFYHYTAEFFSPVALFFFNENQLKEKRFQQSLLHYIEHNPESFNLGLIHSGSELTDTNLLKEFDDFLYWPCSSSELGLRVHQFVNRQKNANLLQNSQSIADLTATFSKLNLCGQSPKFLQALELIKKIASHQATLLIQGETGTGKENAARAVHYLGPRSACAFVPINCATIPDELLESELFGHEKGAFTDARQKHEGLIALANGGTLFLDEVDSLTPKAQAALLRFLQTQEYRPVGSKQFLRANVRIIAATNADLKSLVDEKHFREDLFFRLNVLSLVMPPLRQRADDLPIIAESLVQRFSDEYHMPIKYLSERSLRYLKQQAWRGNVREFENYLLRHFLLSNGKYIDIDADFESSFVEDSAAPENMNVDLIDVNTATNFQNAKALAIESFEKSYLTRLMSMSKGNVTLAAKMAGKERRALGKLLQKYEIDKIDFRQSNFH